MTNLAPYLAAIDFEMRAAIGSNDPALQTFYDWMRYHLGWADEQFRPAQGDSGNPVPHANGVSVPPRGAAQGDPASHVNGVSAPPRGAAQGKRLRPVFCLLACETVSGQYETALPAAAAIEILHNFSLVHDDIEDGDKMRRHRPTLWTLIGAPHAINVGDALFALAQRELLRLSERDVTAERTLRAAQIFQRTCVRLVEGQYLDLRGETMDVETLQSSSGAHRRDATSLLAHYEQMIGGKTAALLGAATAIGAAVATDDAPTITRFHEFGMELGLAFQMTDDILGLWGDPAVTGKPAGADLRKKKKSLPIILAQSRGGALRDALQAAFAQAQIGDAAVDRVMRLMDQADIRAHATHEAEQHRERATRTLARIVTHAVASPSAAQTLAALTDSLTNRNF